MIQLLTVQINRRQPKQTDVIDESIVMYSGTARVGDERAHQGVLRMDHRRRYFSRRAGTTKIEKQTASPTIVDR